MYSQFLAVSLFAVVLSSPVPKLEVNGRSIGKAVGTALGAATGVAAGIPLGPVGIAGASTLGSQGGAVAGEKAGAAIEKAINGKKKDDGDKKNSPPADSDPSPPGANALNTPKPKPPPVLGKPITMPLADKSDPLNNPSNYPSGTATINAGSTHSSRSTSVHCTHTPVTN